MSSEQSRRADDFQCLAESQFFVTNEFAQTLYSDECGMAFIAVINIGMYP